MKKLILLIILITPNAHAAYESNFKQSFGNFYFKERTSTASEHIEVGMKNFHGVELTYRYANLGNTKESRIKFTKKWTTLGHFSLSTRTEYRSFNKKSDYWRARLILEGNVPLSENFSLWGKFDPRWSFKKSGTNADSRHQIGVKYRNLIVAYEPIDRIFISSWSWKYQ